jgi:hypothetical protein
MKKSLCASIVALSLLALPAAAAPAGRLVRHVSDPALESLRAGKVAAPLAVAADERAVLSAADAAAADLASLRAGELTEHEWTMILIGAAVVLILVILL